MYEVFIVSRWVGCYIDFPCSEYVRVFAICAGAFCWVSNHVQCNLVFFHSKITIDQTFQQFSRQQFGNHYKLSFLVDRSFVNGWICTRKNTIHPYLFTFSSCWSVSWKTLSISCVSVWRILSRPAWLSGWTSLWALFLRTDLTKSQNRFQNLQKLLHYKYCSHTTKENYNNNHQLCILA